MLRQTAAADAKVNSDIHMAPLLLLGSAEIVDRAARRSFRS
jgi:hypothetical protein